MTVFKQIHNKFWQNDFVLGLTAEERYFYIYLITNSMTTQCGIYKLNRKLAELETGYTGDKIEKCLEKFEEYGKVIVSKTFTEIMLVNWFKHNLKSSKKTIEIINKELRDVKDKELLKKLYDFSSKRQYPLNEIFSGVIIPEVESEKVESGVKALPEATPVVQEEVNFSVREDESIDSRFTLEQYEATKELSESNSITLSNFSKGDGGLLKGDMDVGNEVEELVLEEYLEDDIVEIPEGTTIASWGFAEDSAAASTGENYAFDDVNLRNTA